MSAFIVVNIVCKETRRTQTSTLKSLCVFTSLFEEHLPPSVVCLSHIHTPVTTTLVDRVATYTTLAYTRPHTQTDTYGARRHRRRTLHLNSVVGRITFIFIFFSLYSGWFIDGKPKQFFVLSWRLTSYPHCELGIQPKGTIFDLAGRGF